MYSLWSGDTAHQRRPDPAHHLQRVLADGSWQGGDARPRPRPPQGVQLTKHSDDGFQRTRLMGHFRTVTLMGTTLTPTPAQHLASPAPPSGEKKSVFYFVLKRRGFGRQLNWPASQSAAFCGREILLTLQKSASTWPWRRANSFFAKKYFNPCYRFGHSLLPSTIERWSKTHRWDTRSVIRQQLLHK